MLSYACLLPHSPLLLTSANSATNPFPQTRAALAAMAAEMGKQGIKTIVSIAAHARYERDGFSLSIAPSLSIDFSPFGDLASRLELKPHWPMYHRLRERAINADVPIHPLDEEHLDYGHGIPLWLLQLSWPRLDGCRILAINDHDSASHEQRLKLGSLLTEVIAERTEPVAVICSGDLHTTRPDALPWDTVKSSNEQLRAKINALFTNAGAAPKIDDITCLTGPSAILHGMLLREKLALTEKSFEHAAPTSFLCSSYVC